MGGDHHHKPPYEVPSAHCFKVEGIPQLEELQCALQQKGLKDPWIRNEAWRYHPGFGSRGARARTFFTRGMPIGFALAVVAAAACKLLGDDGGHH